MERTGPLPRDDRERAVESAVRRFLASDPGERLANVPLFANACRRRGTGLDEPLARITAAIAA